MMWIVLRIVVVTLNISTAFLSPVVPTDSGWSLGLGTGLLTSLFLLVWLSVMRPKLGVELEDPYSLTMPFFPPGRYPLRFLLLGAVSISLSAAVSVVRGYVIAGSGTMNGECFLLIGLSIILTLVIWIRLFGRRVR
jgi:hypothetical protein